MPCRTGKYHETGNQRKSSDESVATVSEDGVVSAVAAGTATISAIAADNEEVTAQCLVTVGHRYGEPVVIKYANCSETGKAVEVCGGCGESREIILPIDSDAHVWGEDYVIDREASEDEEGQKSIHCTLCDAINPESIITIPKVTPGADGDTCSNDRTDGDTDSETE